MLHKQQQARKWNKFSAQHKQNIVRATTAAKTRHHTILQGMRRHWFLLTLAPIDCHTHTHVTQCAIHVISWLLDTRNAHIHTRTDVHALLNASLHAWDVRYHRIIQRQQNRTDTIQSWSRCGLLKIIRELISSETLTAIITIMSSKYRQAQYRLVGS